MALIKCPDCGGQLSTEAISCPHCGRPNRPSAVNTGKPDQTTSLFISADDGQQQPPQTNEPAVPSSNSLPVSSSENPQSKLCPACGKAVNLGATRCAHCFRVISVAPEAPAVFQEPVTSSPESGNSIVRKPCKKCERWIPVGIGTCPHCGQVKPIAISKIVTVGGGFIATAFALGIVGGVIAAVTRSEDPSTLATSKETTARPLPPSPSVNPVSPTAQPEPVDDLPRMPSDEAAFCQIVEQAARTYKENQAGGANELKLSKLRTNRAEILKQALPSRNVHYWIGHVSDLSTTGDGKAALGILLPCQIDVVVKTCNNELSDLGSNTLIPTSSGLYGMLSNFHKGGPIRFDGRFLPDNVNGLKEISLTEQGGMAEPEFLMRFSFAEMP